MPYVRLARSNSRRSLGAIAPELRADAQWLVEQGFVVDYEDKLISIVVRARSLTGAEAEPGAAAPSLAMPSQPFQLC